MALFDNMLDGMKQLDAQAVMAAPAVTMDGEELGPAAKALIWAQAVEEGYTDPAKVIEDWNLTGDQNLSTCVITTRDALKDDFADIEANDPGIYKDFEDYWTGFPIRILLPDGHWVIWME